MRLDRILSNAGCGSRSEVKAEIRKGHVTVNGTPCTDPGSDVGPDDRIGWRGASVRRQEFMYLMLNKPSGVLTAARDPACATVMDLLPDICRKRDCMPVGRLDKDTTGLLLVTDDGLLAHMLISPRRHVRKVYIAQSAHVPTQDEITSFRNGIRFRDFCAMPSELSVEDPDRRLCRVTVYEGKYHQVKRMFSAVGNEVEALQRVEFGPLALDHTLAPGSCRELTEDEVHALREAAQGE